MLAGLVAMFVILAGQCFPAAAEEAPSFNLSVGGVFLRQQPALTSPRAGPAFAGVPHVIVGRTGDNAWLQIQPEGKQAGWVLASLGRVSGELAGLPVAPAPSLRLAGARAPSLRYISTITPAMKKRYRDAVREGRAPGMFAVIGDCNSEPDAYWWRLSAGTFDVSQRPELHRAVERFAWSFTRGSAAARGGFNAAAMFDPSWSDPALCQPGEGPLDCELRLSNASIAFVSLGTGDTFAWKEFEVTLARIVEHLLERKVVPVLVTKADDLESQQADAPAGAINDAVRRLGARYGVPVIEFWQATRPLPDFGMRWEGNENFHMSPAGSDVRIVLTLQALDALTR
jgi:hypothetical protein